jgi:hypothetical protein
MMRDSNGLHTFWRLNRGKILGGLTGLAVALLVMWARWWSVLIIACVLAGSWVGTRFVDGTTDVDLVDE